MPRLRSGQAVTVAGADLSGASSVTVKGTAGTITATPPAASPSPCTWPMTGGGYDGSPRPGGQSLCNMQERARAVGGIVRYHPSAPGGRTVVVQLLL